MSPVHQVWPKSSCKAQWKGEEDKADRGRGGKTTSGNGQAWSSASPRGQWNTGKNGENRLQNRLWCPNDPHGWGTDDDDDDATRASVPWPLSLSWPVNTALGTCLTVHGYRTHSLIVWNTDAKKWTILFKLCRENHAARWRRKKSTEASLYSLFSRSFDPQNLMFKVCFLCPSIAGA